MCAGARLSSSYIFLCRSTSKESNQFSSPTKQSNSNFDIPRLTTLEASKNNQQLTATLRQSTPKQWKPYSGTRSTGPFTKLMMDPNNYTLQSLGLKCALSIQTWHDKSSTSVVELPVRPITITASFYRSSNVLLSTRSYILPTGL
jgi:hypothetical protein